MRIKGRASYTEGCIDKFRPVLHRQCDTGGQARCKVYWVGVGGGLI